MQYLNWFKEGQSNATVVQNPRDGENFIMPDGTVTPKNGTETFGFWLPHGLNATDNATFAVQFNSVRNGSTRSRKLFERLRGSLGRICGLNLNGPSWSNSIEFLPGDDNGSPKNTE